MKKITIAAESLTYSEDIQFLINNRKRISNWWYLHGELESEVGYDKGFIVSHEYLLKKDIIWKEDNIDGKWIYMNPEPKEIYYLEDGIYEVKVLGIDKPCIGYFWTKFEQFDNVIGEYPEMRGLVCFKDDKESIEYAEKCYNKKAAFL